MSRDGPKKTTVFHFSLPEELHERMALLARRALRDRAEIARAALELYITIADLRPNAEPEDLAVFIRDQRRKILGTPAPSPSPTITSTNGTAAGTNGAAPTSRPSTTETNPNNATPPPHLASPRRSAPSPSISGTKKRRP